MKVILKVDIKGTGKKGDILEVNDGYANNFLLKKGMAEKLNAQNLLENQNQKASLQHKLELEKQAALNTCAKLKNTEVVLKIKTGENGKFFGSVTSKEIAEKLSSMGIEVEKKQLVLPAAIKAAGNFVVEAKLYAGITAKFNVKVEAE